MFHTLLLLSLPKAVVSNNQHVYLIYQVKYGLQVHGLTFNKDNEDLQTFHQSQRSSAL